MCFKGDIMVMPNRDLDIDKAFAEMDEGMKNSVPTKILQNVAAEIRKKEHVFKEMELRRLRDWGKLANQIVGAEE